MKIVQFFAVLIISLNCYSQADSSRVIIARDEFGVPHIFGKTDADAAYGLAWAHAEDDFRNIQYVLLTGKGMLGRAIGKKGAIADYAAGLLRCRDIAEAKESGIPQDFRKVLEGYLGGINDYAKKHPEEILVRKAFPATVTDYLAAVSFSLCIISGADDALSAIMGNKVTTIPGFKPGGSNAFAIHSSKTTTGEAFLAINSHQPLEGPTAWYEAHVQSDEGWNAVGGLFPGGLCILHGVNEDLGWAHTVNNMDKVDVFQLKLNSKGDMYEFDGKMLALEKRKLKLKIKGIPVKISKPVFWSMYGATVKTKQGAFAIRLTANQDARAMEQWWRMNKARNFSEFYNALSMQALPMMNIVYADRYDTIFYMSGGKMPERKDSVAFNWQSTVPGNTSASLWETYHEIGELPQLINPASGYLYNTNHSPFLATSKDHNLKASDYDNTSGYENYHNNRSFRFDELISKHGKIDYQQFLDIKYDKKLPKPLQYNVNTDSIWQMDPNKDPDTEDVLTMFLGWDMSADTSSKGAAAFLLMYHYIRNNSTRFGDSMDQNELRECFRYIKEYQMKYFGRTGVPLGELQRHRRGTKDLPAWGLPDVLSAMYSSPEKDGRFKVVAGESYIEMVRFPKNSLPVIESINCYGSSSKPESRHYNDQMEVFLQQKTRSISLDKQINLNTASKIYSPATADR